MSWKSWLRERKETFSLHHASSSSSQASAAPPEVLRLMTGVCGEQLWAVSRGGQLESHWSRSYEEQEKQERVDQEQ